MHQLIYYRGEDLTQIDEDIKREVAGKRMILDKATGKMKEVDAYERPEAADPKKKKVETDKVRAMLSSNVEQSIIPADLSKCIKMMSVSYLEPNLEAPEEEYEIEYVYGYRTFDCRQNL